MTSAEHEWWESAPTWAKWHTWDDLGKTWWQKRPKNYNGRWCHGNEDDMGEWHEYDSAPCPIEIDPSKTLRKRPKEGGGWNAVKSVSDSPLKQGACT